MHLDVDKCVVHETVKMKMGMIHIIHSGRGDLLIKKEECRKKNNGFGGAWQLVLMR